MSGDQGVLAPGEGGCRTGCSFSLGMRNLGGGVEAIVAVQLSAEHSAHGLFQTGGGLGARFVQAIKVVQGQLSGASGSTQQNDIAGTPRDFAPDARLAQTGGWAVGRADAASRDVG